MRCIFTLLVIVALPLAASAHGLILEARLENGVLTAKVFYDDGDPAVGATVTVEAGNTVAEGRTDAAGTWPFPAPPPGAYTITANAGDGHLAKVTLTVPADGPAAVQSQRRLTGPQRRALTAGGLAAIAGLTLGLRALLRRRAAGKSSPAEPLAQP